MFLREYEKIMTALYPRLLFLSALVLLIDSSCVVGKPSETADLAVTEATRLPNIVIFRE